MPTIEEILAMPVADQVAALQRKEIVVPKWADLKKEYMPELHPVMDKGLYPDTTDEDGRLVPVTRVTYDLQRLAARRMTEMCYGIPVVRNYQPRDDRQAEVAKVMEAVFKRCRVDSSDIERGNMLFAGCETFRIWYAIETPNKDYGVDSPIKLRTRNYSPMNGDELFPLFDENGDMIAMSIVRTVTEIRGTGTAQHRYMDTYTNDRHLLYENSGAGWTLAEEEDISNIGKIPGVYLWRPTPIWEHTSNIVYELEWANSRNGNYIRKNSKPIFVVFADEDIRFGQEKDENREFRGIFRYPKGSDARYVTWPAATDALKAFNQELRQSFFTQLQLPDLSYENLKSMPMSGEAMKQMFIDAHMKVMDEKGRLMEAHDREINVIRPFLKTIMGEGYADAIDALQVDCDITPYTINDEGQTIQNYVTATAGKPVMSQRQAITLLGLSGDVDATLEEIQRETQAEYLESME